MINVTVKFEVSDSGIGINQEQQSRIFESFEQANMNTTKKYGGTGRGLSISQNILLLMGSSLAVSSEPMVGSTFWFELNFKKPTRKICIYPIAQRNMSTSIYSNNRTYYFILKMPLVKISLIISVTTLSGNVCTRLLLTKY